MNILITNDDGYYSKGIKVLARILSQFGSVTVVAPKHHQSGMGMAVSIGPIPIAYKHLGIIDGVDWAYLDATPASCVKHGFNFKFKDRLPDVVVSGINHGSNTTISSCYSGTLGAAQEATIYGVPAIGVSLCTSNPDADFSEVEKYFPQIFQKIMENYPKTFGTYYNINFPTGKVKGVRVATMGRGKWIKEFTEWNPDMYIKHGLTAKQMGSRINYQFEEGEEMLMMLGEYMDSPSNREDADHLLVKQGYATIVAGNIDSTDYEDADRINKIGFNQDF